MSSNALIFYCPVCRHTSAVPEEHIAPGPVMCGRCHTERQGAKVEMKRDTTAEGGVILQARPLF